MVSAWSVSEHAERLTDDRPADRLDIIEIQRAQISSLRRGDDDEAAANCSRRRRRRRPIHFISFVVKRNRRKRNGGAQRQKQNGTERRNRLCSRVLLRRFFLGVLVKDKIRLIEAPGLNKINT